MREVERKRGWKEWGMYVCWVNLGVSDGTYWRGGDLGFYGLRKGEVVFV